MVLTDCPEQLDESADKLKGEETSAPLPGLLMLTSVKAGTAAMSANNRRAEGNSNFFIDQP